MYRVESNESEFDFLRYDNVIAPVYIYLGVHSTLDNTTMPQAVSTLVVGMFLTGCANSLLYVHQEPADSEPNGRTSNV